MFRDFRHAARALAKSPGFALVAIDSLALGIGANSAIFSLADGALLRPMPVPNTSQLMVNRLIREFMKIPGDILPSTRCREWPARQQRLYRAPRAVTP